jgi:hypothetical protein
VGAYFLHVVRGVKPEMLVAAVDAWDEIVRREEKRFRRKGKGARKDGKR